MATSVLHQLQATIELRKSASSDSSYTAKLLAGGVAKINEKVIEEAAELAESAVEHGDKEVIHETADLLYHVLVLLASRGLSLTEVEQELARRFGTSGLEEKASRKS